MPVYEEASSEPSTRMQSPMFENSHSDSSWNIDGRESSGKKFSDAFDLDLVTSDSKEKGTTMRFVLATL